MNIDNIDRVVVEGLRFTITKQSSTIVDHSITEPSYYFDG